MKILVFFFISLIFTFSAFAEGSAIEQNGDAHVDFEKIADFFIYNFDPHAYEGWFPFERAPLAYSKGLRTKVSELEDSDLSRICDHFETLSYRVGEIFRLDTAKKQNISQEKFSTLMEKQNEYLSKLKELHSIVSESSFFVVDTMYTRSRTTEQVNVEKIVESLPSGGVCSFDGALAQLKLSGFDGLAPGYSFYGDCSVNEIALKVTGKTGGSEAFFRAQDMAEKSETYMKKVFEVNLPKPLLVEFGQFEKHDPHEKRKREDHGQPWAYKIQMSIFTGGKREIEDKLIDSFTSERERNSLRTWKQYFKGQQPNREVVLDLAVNNALKQKRNDYDKVAKVMSSAWSAHDEYEQAYLDFRSTVVSLRDKFEIHGLPGATPGKEAYDSMMDFYKFYNENQSNGYLGAQACDYSLLLKK